MLLNPPPITRVRWDLFDKRIDLLFRYTHRQYSRFINYKQIHSGQTNRISRQARQKQVQLQIQAKNYVISTCIFSLETMYKVLEIKYLDLYSDLAQHLFKFQAPEGTITETNDTSFQFGYATVNKVIPIQYLNGKLLRVRFWIILHVM